MPPAGSAALLGFAISIDDFVITYLVSGPDQTFPVFVWGISRVTVPPQVNVVASAIFFAALLLALAIVLYQRFAPAAADVGLIRALHGSGRRR